MSLWGLSAIPAPAAEHRAVSRADRMSLGLDPGSDLTRYPIDPVAAPRQMRRSRFSVRDGGRISRYHAFRESDQDLARHYAEATWEIPLFFLSASIAAIERTRVFPSLPAVGEVWTTARMCAGMHRQQYRAGHYLPPPRTWPPAWRRHAVHAGELEPILRDPMRLLGCGEIAQLGGSRVKYGGIHDDRR